MTSYTGAFADGLSPADPAYFEAAMRDFQKAVNDYTTAGVNLLAANQTLFEERRKLQGIEDEVLVNGGTGEQVIDGKNGEMREAQLRSILAVDEWYQSTLKNVRKLETAKADLTSQQEHAANRMSIARRRADYAIAEVHRDAAIQGGLGTTRESR